MVNMRRLNMKRSIHALLTSTLGAVLILNLLLTYYPAVGLGVGGYQQLHQYGRGTARLVAWQPGGSSIAVAGSLGVWLYTSDFRDDGQLVGSSEVGSIA